MESAAADAPPLLEVVVSGWVDATNRRDLAGILARLDPDVCFHPLRLTGLDGSYRAHDGVRRWFERLSVLQHEHVIDLSAIEVAGDGQMIAVGALRLGGVEVGPFCALHAIRDGLIVTAHQYFTDRGMLERIGLVR